MFFCASPLLLQVRFFCITFWSSPFMAMVMNIPARKLLKNALLERQFQSKIVDFSLLATVANTSVNSSPIWSTIIKILITTANNKKVVCKVSVQTIVLIPPRNVYNQINAMVIITVTQNGIPKASKNAICKTKAAKNNRKEAPIVWEIRKNEAPA